MNNVVRNRLPKGQFDLGLMPRFGLPTYASRLPSKLDDKTIRISGDVDFPGVIDLAESDITRRDQISDFHCVTSWSCTEVSFRGWTFIDFWEQIILPQFVPKPGAAFVIFGGHDGYAACLPIEDVLARDVLIVDEMNDAKLSPNNGAPLRLVAPAHYGYKSVKHLRFIKIVKDADAFRGPALKFLVHPRARVALEERGLGVPAWILRNVYKLFIRPNIWLFGRAR